MKYSEHRYARRKAILHICASGEMLQIEVSETQIYRVTDFYGKEVGATVNEEPVLSPVKGDEVMYAEADGSMILTREEGWSEGL